MAREIILLFKYRGYRILAGVLSRLVVEATSACDDLWWNADALVPVPLHPRRRRERGFNQAEDIARSLGRMLEMELVTGVLRKKRHTAPQTALSYADRKRNLAHAFICKHTDRIADKTVVLVDDVYTTGATLRACSRVLKAAGAKDVRAVTVAQA